MNKPNRITLTRLLISYILLFYSIRFFQHLTPSGLLGPPLFSLNLDLAYWFNRLMHIPAIVLYNRAGACIFDGLVFLSGTAVLIFPLARAAVISFSLLLILYAINFNSIAIVHTVTVHGLILILLSFWVHDDDRFALTWEGMRYLTCLLYFGAFFWKSVYGQAFFSWSTGSEVFHANLVDYLYHNPDTIMAGVFRWFIRHPWLVNAGAIFVYLLEGAMLIGLFTRKYDRWLGWIPVIITFVNYFFADVFIFELLVLNFPFVSWERWGRIAARWPAIIYIFSYGKTIETAH